MVGPDAHVSTLLSLSGIVKRYPGVTANDGIDLEFRAGEIHALLGENGAGKSTLMQIAYGMVAADAGEIRVRGEPVRFSSPRDAIARGVGMIHQEFMLVPTFTVAENVALGLRKGRGPFLDLARVSDRIRAISLAHGLSVRPEDRVGHLPIGVRQRVEIVKLLFREAWLLILDEPTAVLTPAENRGLFAVLRSLAAEGRSVAIVTHKLQEVMALADRVTVMRDGKIVASGAVAEYSPAALATLMIGRAVDLRRRPGPQRPGAVVLRVDALHARDGARSERLRGVSFTLHEGEILGIAGVDGNGQSELVETIMNLRPARSGRVTIRDRRLDGRTPRDCRAEGIAYIPADRRNVGSLTGLPMSITAILGRHRRFANRLGLLDLASIQAHTSRLIGRFGVRGGDRGPAGKLSGGNLQKLIVGREIEGIPDVIIVEQPTRGLDVGAVEAVWTELLALRASGKAILLISTELEEIFSLSDRIAVMFAGRLAATMPAAEATMEGVGALMAGMQAPGAH